MKRILLALLLAAATGLSLAQSGSAGLAVSGTVSGSVPAQARVGGFVLDSSGAPVSELVSVPVNGGRFILELPSVTPPQRSLSPLRPDGIFWPGVLEPITVTGQASSADLRFYVYGDGNGNGRRDETEALQEAVPFVGKAVLVVSYSSAVAQVNAARGFQANLKAGWNGLLIEVGKVVKVTSSSTVSGVSLNAQR
ncbi:hypothetical protein [Deinococcus sp.]|uniref:hypothetical protein n=1 Tax=Deinococcus sp. TaxID=47478 RepID=UPI003C7B674B